MPDLSLRERLLNEFSAGYEPNDRDHIDADLVLAVLRDHLADPEVQRRAGDAIAAIGPDREFEDYAAAVFQSVLPDHLTEGRC